MRPFIFENNTMPWKPLCPKTKRQADKLAKSKVHMRPACWTARRREIADQYKLGFWARLKFWHRASK